MAELLYYLPDSNKDRPSILMSYQKMMKCLKQYQRENGLWGQSLVDYINEEGDIANVCEGTNRKNDYQYYLDRKSKVGDMHGQAPILWCAWALLFPDER